MHKAARTPPSSEHTQISTFFFLSNPRSVYFVHGINGHAYSTFASRATDPRHSCLWPKDILPEALERAGYFGRYLTFGYDADVRRGKYSPSELQETAEQLLNNMESSRPEEGMARS